MAKYGSLISGDKYIALKSGPAPFHVLSIIRDIQEHNTNANAPIRSKICIEKQYLRALAVHDRTLLSLSEVECLFETIQKYKAVPIDVLNKQTLSKAWLQANISGEISFADMIAESGASEEMERYIEMAYKDEIDSFNIHHEN